MARVSYSMAETKLFPRQFTHLDARTKVPTYSLWFQFWCVTIIGIGANVASRSGLFPDAYAFLGDTFGFMYAFVAALYGFCVVSLRYTDPQLARPFRIGKKGNLLVWIMAVITAGIWGYAAIGCVQWGVQVTGGYRPVGIPIWPLPPDKSGQRISRRRRRRRRRSSSSSGEKLIFTWSRSKKYLSGAKSCLLIFCFSSFR